LKANRVRIVGGEWRSRYINFPDGRDLRPTPDRVRETLFNWLGQDLTDKCCLDLYAGSGALGFEAASRGAERVVLVERERTVCTALEASCAALKAAQVTVVRADALEFLRSENGDSGVYDVVFLDPPFADNPWDTLFARLIPRLKPNALVYRESGGKQTAPDGWEVHRQSRAGQVNYQLLKRKNHDDQSGLPRNI
jgi:16S rRNA (guanine966-N2)-methyltransferase